MNRIRQLRKCKGYSQSELGAKVGKSLSAISKWELEISQPSFEDVDLLCTILESSLGYLLGHEQTNTYRLSSECITASENEAESLSEAALALAFWERYKRAPSRTRRAIDALLEDELS